MALSFYGWLTFLAIILMFIVGCGFGIKLMYDSKKLNVKLLFYIGLAIMLMPFPFMGELIDYITIITTGKNNENLVLLGIFSLIWWAPLNFLGIYIGTKLYINSEYGKYIIRLTLILCILLEVLLFTDPRGIVAATPPPKAGEDATFFATHFGIPFFYVYLVTALFGIVLLGINSLRKAIKSTGLIRKKNFFLTIGFFTGYLSAVSYTFLSHGISYTIISLIYAFSIWFYYLALREEPEKKEKIQPTKEVKVKGDLFRISKYKKEDITEEEVSISKEKKICLVCKGKVLGHNVFICPECETFYCEKCSDALSNLENACWVCDAPFDESKPVKPFKKEEEIEEIEISEKPQKKPKVDKKPSKKQS